MAKMTKGRAGKLAKDTRPHAERIREIYLTAFSREPTADESRVMLAFVEKRSARMLEAYEDVLWSIVNAKEFFFNH
jgi:hypothetical protein